MNILIVEDNRFVMLNHQIMADCLCEKRVLPDLHFDFAENYFESMRRLRADHPSHSETLLHAFISDFKFPLNSVDQHSGGAAFFSAVIAKYEEEKRQRPPFFYLSHRSDTEIREELTQAGIPTQPTGIFNKSKHTLFTVMDHIRAKFPMEAYKPANGYNSWNTAKRPTHG